MKTDEKIKKDVLDELAWQANIKENEIGVIAKNGVVTLSGTVDSYTKKMAAEQAARNVAGVKAIAEEIDVEYGTSYKKTDSEIATAAANALERNFSVPENEVNVKVEDGWVYLTGEVERSYERAAAKNAVQDLTGVKYVANNIKLKQNLKPSDIKDRIIKAFKRSAEIDSKKVSVDVDGHTVKLRGKVHSLTEKDDARRAAYFAPGVYKVENELEVAY